MLDFLSQSVFSLAGHKPKGRVSSSGAIDSRDGIRVSGDPGYMETENVDGIVGNEPTRCFITCDIEWSIESSDRWAEYEACDMDWAEPLGLARFKFPVIHSLSDLIDNPTFDFELEEVASYWEFGKRRSVFRTTTRPIQDSYPVYMHGGPKDGERVDCVLQSKYLDFPYLPPEEARAVWYEEDEPLRQVKYETVRYRQEKAAIGRFVMPVMVWDKLSPESLNEWLQQPGSFAKLL